MTPLNCIINISEILLMQASQKDAAAKHETNGG
jgi:hypothetical protein